MKCEEYQARRLAGEVTPGDAAHLAGCRDCREQVPELDRLRRRLDDPRLWEEPRDDLRDRVLAQLGGHQASGSPPAAAAGRWPPRTTTRFLAAVAAVVLLVVGAGLARWRWGDERPDWTVQLAAGPAAAGARATVSGWNEEYGTRMELNIEGLPTAGDGSFYEIWLSSPDGRHVSAGTFSGSGTIEAWAGVSRSEFPRVWVTHEPNDGDAALNGDTVLDMAT